jgi:Ni/Fe-hydrogenase subunit HybB-like protein
MNLETTILFILCFFALAGGAAILQQLIHGFKKTNLSDHYVWGIYIQGCFFLSSLAAGVLIILSVMILLNIKGISRLAETGSIIAFSLFIGSQILLGIDLGKPSRAILMLKSKNFHSPLTWDFYTLGSSTVLCLIYYLGILPQTRGAMLAWSLLSLLIAYLCLSVHTMFFLSRAKGGYQTNAFSGLETLLSSLLGGTALLMLSGIQMRLSGLLLILAVLLLGTTASHNIALLRQNHNSKSVLILNLAIVLLLLVEQSTEKFLQAGSIVTPTAGGSIVALTAAAASLVLVFIEKFNAVILPQRESILPEPYNQFQDKSPYRPSLKEINVLIGCFAICAFIGYGLLYVKAGW